MFHLELFMLLYYNYCVNKVVVPISGGIDSTVLLHYAVRSGRFDEVHAISFHYGQRHSRELISAEYTAEKLGVNHKLIRLDFFKDINTYLGR